MGSISTQFPDVDIIISTYNRGDRIALSVESILENTYPHFILWIIDESKDNRTQTYVQHVAQHDRRVRYVPSNLQGLAAKRNEGFALGSAPFVLFTNDDCRVSPDWVRYMRMELLQSDHWAVFGMVAPGTKDPAGAPWYDPDSNREIVLALKETPQPATYGKNRFDLGFGHGHNMGFQRLRFAEIGGIDEELGAGSKLGVWDERDLGYRVLARRGSIRYIPEAVVYHHHWLRCDDVMRQSRNYAMGAGSSAAKYVRCGDMGGWYILGEWIVDQGLRQVLSGIVKHRSRIKIEAGLNEIYYSLVGFVRGWKHPVDRQQMLFSN
jgi:GT2 family glycosyltransferase